LETIELVTLVNAVNFPLHPYTLKIKVNIPLIAVKGELGDAAAVMKVIVKAGLIPVPARSRLV
jgi:hypothetical protein